MYPMHASKLISHSFFCFLKPSFFWMFQAVIWKVQAIFDSVFWSYQTTAKFRIQIMDFKQKSKALQLGTTVGVARECWARNRFYIFKYKVLHTQILFFSSWLEASIPKDTTRKQGVSWKSNDLKYFHRILNWYKEWGYY